MKFLKALYIFSNLLLVPLFCCCSVLASSPAFESILPIAPRPPDVAMNEDAGLGNWIVINIRLAGGENFPVVLDTGCATTCLDTSFESKLGRPIETNTLWDFGVKSTANVFLAPKLFLKDTPLAKIGPFVVTAKCKEISSAVGHPVMGILGMDVLQNYCIQLDFASRKIRFLNYDRANKSHWGVPSALVGVGDGCVAINENLAGIRGSGSLIDTGYNQDGWLGADLFEQWTNRAAPLRKGEVHSPDGILGAQIYPAMNLRGVDRSLLSTDDAHIKFNGIGLRFLARHLVTMDFPEQTLYLKHVSDGPPIDKNLELDGKSTVKFLKNLVLRGQLPGWAKNDTIAGGRVTVHCMNPDTFNCDLSKNGDPFIYHYTISRASGSGPWQLRRAWETDAKGTIVRGFPVP
ncbi:MAG TPA: hypothetical protein VH280_07995 [Verrucomicrobiae bacterium]|jgi:hypothetical protein|nr:hypothetical protein [Verrucomicrobiae bacterium]